MKNINLNEAEDDEDKKERVIFLWSIPANGHLNPTLCFTNQLLLKLDEMKVKKIVFYCGLSFRDLILNLPNNIGNRIEFRDYRLEKYSGSENLLKLIMNFDTRPGTLFRVFQCWENAVNLGNKHLFKSLLRDIQRDKPVLILYDQALFFPKLAFKLYSKMFKCPPPLHVCYVTTFLCAKDIYPTWGEMDKMGLMGNNTLTQKVKSLFLTIFDFMKYVYTYYKTLWWDHGFSILEIFKKCELPFGRDLTLDDNLNLVFVLPEIQPRLSAFQASNIKFVGPAVDENVRSKISCRKNDMDKYVDVIENFLKKNLKSEYTENNNVLNQDNLNQISSQYANFEQDSLLMRSNSTGDNFKKFHKPIIYVSMGTVFNNENSNLFEIIVEACKSFSDDYSVIVSTGDEKTYEKYANSYLNSDKILFVPHTPQVEILKRAYLFITHAGMNSVSEALQYGVPIICLPLSGDQPFVAWRVADELGIGIRLQADDNLTVSKVKEAITEILTKSIYRERANDLSLISKRYCGHKLATDHIVDFLSQNEHVIENNIKISRSSSTSSLIKNIRI